MMFNNLQKSFILVLCVFIAGSVFAGRWVNWGEAKRDVSNAAHTVADSGRAVADTVVEKSRSAAETVVDGGRAAVDTVVEAVRDAKDTVVTKKNEYTAKREAKKAAQ